MAGLGTDDRRIRAPTATPSIGMSREITYPIGKPAKTTHRLTQK